MRRILLIFTLLVFCCNCLASEPWSGKKALFIGDSITDPGRVGTTKCYWEYLIEDLCLDAVSTSIGRNGAQILHFLEQAELALKMQADGGFTWDAIFVFGGTNDFNSNVPMGEWYSIQRETVRKDASEEHLLHRSFNFSESDFRGRLNLLLSELKTVFPDTQIIIMTPVHRAYAHFGENNIQPDENWANCMDLFIDDYAMAIREASVIWSVPCIDLFSESGILPLESAYDSYIANPTRDRLHPNAKGHLRIARTIEARLNSISPSIAR